VLFNNAVNCNDYRASVINELMNVEHWWKDTDRGKPKCSDRTLSQYNFVHPKPQTVGRTATTHTACDACILREGVSYLA
jgi:hypothetical protein